MDLLCVTCRISAFQLLSQQQLSCCTQERSEDLRVFVEVLQSLHPDSVEITQLRASEAQLRSKVAKLQADLDGHHLQQSIKQLQQAEVCLLVPGIAVLWQCDCTAVFLSGGPASLSMCLCISLSFCVCLSVCLSVQAFNVRDISLLHGQMLTLTASQVCGLLC